MSDPPAPGSGRTPAPHVLLAEDDDTSRHYLAEALRELGCRVEACADGHATLGLARHHRFDLLLLDCRMPGAGAADILAHLRSDRLAASRASPAIASSAELDAAAHAGLRAAGFATVLAKPLSMRTLETALDIALRPLPAAGAEWLDDGAALLSSGNAETVHALRTLFDDELRHLLQDLDTLARQPQEFRERLHRLLASCGFCGATSLAVHAGRLKRELDSDGQLAADALAAFRAAVITTLGDLAARLAETRGGADIS